MIRINGKDVEDIFGVLRVMAWSEEDQAMIQIWPDDDDEGVFVSGYWIDNYYWDDNSYWNDD